MPPVLYLRILTRNHTTFNRKMRLAYNHNAVSHNSLYFPAQTLNLVFILACVAVNLRTFSHHSTWNSKNSQFICFSCRLRDNHISLSIPSTLTNRCSHFGNLLSGSHKISLMLRPLTDKYFHCNARYLVHHSTEATSLNIMLIHHKN